ncbi:MAG: 30S ribosomal protein S17e [Thaumarchaeota archaeon]|nr:30S ribosomal protein S17e [Nitrososphaerota archaeon]
MDRTRRFSEQIMKMHPEAFSSDYQKNKEALVELTFIPSKQLRNHIAGYIAKALKEEASEDEEAPGEEIAE